jgi:hypothetical protein
MEIEFPLEFVVYGTPVSSGASSRSKRAWKAEVKEASYLALPEGHFWYEGPAALTLYFFPIAPMSGDIDNIIKMTQDALTAHILRDDRQIERVVAQRFDPGSVFAFTDPSDVLAAAITSDEPALYVRLSTDPYEDLA